MPDHGSGHGRGSVSLLLRALAFTVVVPGAGGVYVPWLIITRGGAAPQVRFWYASAVIACGLLLYLCCLRLFATAGRGTPGLWDPPRRFVVVGPYRWVRNPIYLSALLIVGGEAWLFVAPALLLYTGALALGFHLLVVAYEEPKLRARFGEQYVAYTRAVSRWILRPPRGHAA